MTVLRNYELRVECLICDNIFVCLGFFVSLFCFCFAFSFPVLLFKKFSPFFFPLPGKRRERKKVGAKLQSDGIGFWLF